MTLVLGCVADDYTGASDLANTLTRNGLRTVQTIGVPEGDLPASDVDAVVVALKSRSIPAEAAVAACRAAERWLRGAGASHILFKICSTFDSTDAGNIGPVAEALAEDCGADAVLVTPAFPETGRTVYQGHLFVGAVPLDESPLKDHPLNPMRDANLARVLARQCKRGSGVGVIGFGIVARGAPTIVAEAEALARAGQRMAIVDAIRESDLEAIGHAALAGPLSVGASGLGLGLARALVATERVRAKSAADGLGSVGGSAACLAGSCSRATLEQIARAESHMPVLRLDPERLIAGGEAIEEALTWAGDRLAEGPVLLASSAAPQDVAAMQARHGREASGQAIETALATIAEGLVRHGVRRLVVAGGETSGAVVDRLGVRAFLVGPEIAAGVPLLRSVGRDGGEMLMALKSGNFGGVDFFERALGMMA